MSHRPSSAAGTSQIELEHFWQEGGGKRMVSELFADFRSRHPDVDLSEQANTIDDHGMLVKSQILRETPPAVFVEWPGGNLEPYQAAGTLRDLTELWERNGWADAFIEGPRERCRIDGGYYGIPIDIHRMNNLFYHVDLAEEHGVDPSSVRDPREFLEVIDGLGDEGVIGLEQPMKNPSDVLQFLANVVIGQFGAETYAGLTQGRTREYRSELREAVELLDEYAALARDDSTFIDMVEANDRFVDRQAVTFCQGDWMAGAYAEEPAFEYGEHWDRANFPGTDGVFMLATDAVVAAADAEFDEPTEAFLEFMASPAAQETLNRIKGSIPPREDVSLDAFPQILREQYRDFKRADHFPAGHSLQISPEAFVEAKIAASEFVTTRDVERTTEALLEAYSNN